MEWTKDNNTIFYVTEGEVHCPYKVCKFTFLFIYSLANETSLEAEKVSHSNFNEGNYRRCYVLLLSSRK